MTKISTEPEYIKAELRIRYGSVFNFEDAHELPRKSVSDFLRGRTNRRVSDAISKVLGRKVRASDKSDSSRAAATHRLNAGAR